MPLNNSEWKVMQVVWDGSPVTARGVHDRIAEKTGWAYTTVKTQLARLTEKGVLCAVKQGAASLYTPLVTRDEAQGSAVHALLDQAFQGAFSPLLQFLADQERLSPSEREELTELLARAEGQADEA